jgi:glutamate synthase domain-containing protein 2
MGGDIIWEIGSGYFGCRNSDGSFCAEKFAEAAAAEQVKMVELKLSQGAKPGHGGVLPGAKVSREIAFTRGVPMGKDCISPSKHSAFACNAMVETGYYPDFIVVDGKEGGTGAAPLEFIDHLGMPLREGLSFVHNALIGIGARDRIRIGASGKIISAFDIARAIALGADWCNSARGFMFALGCIQSQSCHTDYCPTGVATQDRTRQRALVVPDKLERVANFHTSTMHSLTELTAAAGLDHPREFSLNHFCRRVSASEVKTFEQLYSPLAAGELLQGSKDPRFRDAWLMASASDFRPLPLRTQ